VTPVRTILDLPFRQRPAIELLGIGSSARASALDLDWGVWGWTRVGPLWLEGARSASSSRIDDALLLALHSADDADALEDDIEVELELDDIEAGAAVTVLLSALLDRWLPRLPAAPAIVLALCNRHGSRVGAPVAARGAPLWYGLGDVDAWLDDVGADRGGRLRLVADAWLRAE
jgi:hypothetical protein